MSKEQGLIMVVEDTHQIRELLEATLRFQGYTVDSAQDGEEALEKISKQPPELIITDLLMPNMDGYALLYRLHGNPETRHIPILVLSATYVSREDKEFALILGAQEFMEKPFDISEFLLKIGEMLAQGPVAAKGVLDDQTFFRGYKTRLEAKLRAKTEQLSRTKRLLMTLPEAQKAAFQKLLDDVRQSRDEIQAELREIIGNLDKLQ
ncbi:MAG: response regulator [Chloroflexi bacterium]|nr:response regulator [Chloroflexota bacterium]